MSREKTKEACAVMSHYADGGEVQCRLRQEQDPWHDVLPSCWNWNLYEYRIKPAPLRYWRNVYSWGGIGGVNESREDADNNVHSYPRYAVQVLTIDPECGRVLDITTEEYFKA